MTQPFDVAILGSGLGGSVLASLLARRGRRVALIDKQPHPRFAIGESTLVYTTQTLASLAERYDIPALAPKRIRRAVGDQCGVKRHFGYVYHHEGAPADPDEVMMAWIGPPEFHFFRADVDRYLFDVALDLGVTPFVGAGVTRVDADPDGVVIHLDDATTVAARFVVDGTGFRSVLAEQHGLRKPDPGLHTHTRTLFTHMRDVRPFDTIMPRRRHKMPGPLHEGTLHHVFDGGWLWVIPFDNHKGSRNPLVSVGLQLDCRRFPIPTDQTPEEEFRTFLDRYPSLAEQFEGAVAVRPWVRTGRLQFASTTAVPGPRQALLPHAYGFIDPLYSRGLAFTLDGVKFLAHALLSVDDPGDADLSGLDPLYDKLTTAHDQLVYGSLISWKHHELWKTWWYVWMLSTASQFFVLLARHRWRLDHDDPLVDEVDHHPVERIKGYEAFMAEATDLMVQVDEGRLDPRDARDAMMALLRRQPFHYEPVVQHLLTTRKSRPPSVLWDLPALTRFAYWVGTKADPEIHDMVMPFVKGAVFRYAWTTV